MNTPSPVPAYDAFGDVAVPARLTASQRARKLAVAVFWSVALLLVAGRIYQHDHIGARQSQAVEMASR